MPSSDITLYNPASGEVIALVLRDAPDEQLADVAEAKLPALREELAKAEAAVSTEWLRRLDRSGRWTRRVGDPKDGFQWEIKSPSPDASSTEYDVDALEEVLTAALADDDLDQDAADRALERTVTVVFRVSTAEEVARLVEQHGADSRVIALTPARKVKAGGVKAMQKVPAMAERIAAGGVVRDVSPPPRKARVNRIEKAAR